MKYSKLPAYKGKESYTFVSYSHKDSNIVYPIIEQLNDKGCNIWYDEGIPIISDYGSTLYQHIKGCTIFLFFISKNSVCSEDVEKEVLNAIGLKKSILLIRLDESPLPPSIAYHIPPTRQYISININRDVFYGKLIEALKPCIRKEISTQFKKNKDNTTIAKNTKSENTIYSGNRFSFSFHPETCGHNDYFDRDIEGFYIELSDLETSKKKRLVEFHTTPTYEAKFKLGDTITLKGDTILFKITTNFIAEYPTPFDDFSVFFDIKIINYDTSPVINIDTHYHPINKKGPKDFVQNNLKIYNN